MTQSNIFIVHGRLKLTQITLVKQNHYNATQRNATQRNTTQHNTTQHNTTQHNSIQYNTIQYTCSNELRSFLEKQHAWKYNSL
jgi:hypothetical protein